MADLVTDPSRYSELRGVIVHELQDDHIGLWSVLWEARRVFPEFSAEDSRLLVIRLVRDLLLSGVAFAGAPKGDAPGFVRWQMTPDEAISRIDREWRDLGRDPRLGDIVWLTAPGNG